jgi:hypothetical protein
MSRFGLLQFKMAEETRQAPASVATLLGLEGNNPIAMGQRSQVSPSILLGIRLPMRPKGHGITDPIARTLGSYRLAESIVFSKGFTRDNASRLHKITDTIS